MSRQQQGSGSKARRNSAALGRWYRQKYDDKAYNKRTGLMVMNFYPGRGLERFDNPIQPVGVGIMIALWYRLRQIGNKLLRAIPVRGYTAEVDGHGFVRYGGTRGVEFNLDLGARPMFGGRGRVFDLNRHEGLLTRVLGMDAATGHAVNYLKQLRQVPEFPYFYAVLPTHPDYQETPELIALACQRMRCSERELRANPMFAAYMIDLFNEAVIPPHHPANQTGGYLVRTDYIRDAHDCTFVEDYRHLLGQHAWNPGRRLADLGREALKANGLTRGHMAALEETQIDRIVAKMRTILGEHHAAFTDEELVEALVDDRAPQKTDGTTLQILVGDLAYLDLLRSYMSPVQAAQATDEDLLQAAADLNAPLVLSRVCRTQVLSLPTVPEEESNVWTPEMLGRQLLAELEVDNPRQKPRKEKHGPRADAQPAVVADAGQQADVLSDVAEVA